MTNQKVIKILAYRETMTPCKDCRHCNVKINYTPCISCYVRGGYKDYDERQYNN